MLIVDKNLAAYKTTLDQSLRNAVERMNEVNERIQMIVDTDSKLVGVLTDGDIRRSLLRGVTMDSPVRDAACLDPTVGSYTDIDAANALWRQAKGKLRFLPLVDNAQVLCGLMVPATETTIIRQAAIMAGGYGSRLGSFTKDKPKPLVEVGGRPILDHILTRLESGGISKVFVCVHHLAESISNFVGSRSNSADVRTILENTKLGTAGPLAKLAGSVDYASGPLLVLNGDVITNVDIRQIGHFHVEHGNDVTIGAAVHRFRIPYGVIHHDEDGRFVEVEEKPLVENFISAGVYVFNRQVLDLIEEDQQMDMPHLLNLTQKAGFRIGLFPIHEFWADIGQPQDIETTNQHQHLWDA